MISGNEALGDLTHLENTLNKNSNVIIILKIIILNFNNLKNLNF